MTIQIVTDSTSDVSPELANELCIHIIPGYIRFGNAVYRDGIDIKKSEFYKQLVENPLPPLTYEASVKDFVAAYSNAQDSSDGIVSIHISSKLSRMYDSARRASKKIKSSYTIEIIDSHFASIGLSLIVINAAKLAKAGENIKNIVSETNKTISQIHMLGLFDTLKYATRGGRVTKHVMELSSIFKIKPLLTFRDGEVVVEGLARTLEGGIERLYEFVNSTPRVQDLAIAYSTNYEMAIELKRRLASKFPEERIYIEQIGSALGAHSGPDAIFVALRHS